MERKEPYASQEEFDKRVSHYPDIPLVEMRPGSNSHLVCTKNITISFITMDANIRPLLHHHESEQVMIVVDGECDEIVEGKLYHLRKGDVIRIPSNIEHGAYISDRGCKAIDIFSPPRKDLAEKLEKVSGV